MTRVAVDHSIDQSIGWPIVGAGMVGGANYDLGSSDGGERER